MAKKSSGLFDDDVGGAGKDAIFNTARTRPSLSEEKISDTQRQRRSDYKGTPSRKKDYHYETKMIGVRVPLDVAQEIEYRAEAKGETKNAWLLALIMAELEK